MMYWIVFALFTCIETFTDVFLSWFPFYYEIKIILVIWLLSPATKGSSILYRKFVHPTLSSKEQEIDEYITKAKEQSYKQVLDFGSKGVSAIMQTALKSGGGLVNQLKKSYSLSDLTDTSFDETDADVVVSDARLQRRRRSPHRGAASTDIYFGEVDVRADRVACLQSAEDVSSGYSSGEGLSLGKVAQLPGREGLQRAGSLTRSRTSRATRSNVPRKGGLSEDSDDNIIFIDGSMKTIDQLGQTDSSSSETVFLETLEHVDSNKNLNSDRHTGTHPVLTACEGPALGKSLVDITKNVHTFSNFLQDLIEIKNSGDSPAPSGGEKCKRGGRYNKRAAPPVPPIKATLVLKPGMVKTLGASEVFVAPPRSRSRLGGKFGLWGKDRQRASWHCEGGDQSAMAVSRSFSKSDSDLGVSDLGVLRGSRSGGRLRHLGKKVLPCHELRNQ